ncbi:hypothetical protein HRH25_06160 [Flavisolibacter sp. BT320]|nr:hypothetical protein [Flavisolibacter longurius]
MKKYLFFSLLLLCKNAFAQKGLAEMIAAEKSFAMYSVLHGTKEAFLQFADSNSIMFSRGEPVNGFQLWRDRENKPGVLNWRPRYAEIAASGDFGYTCGPWTFQPSTTEDPVIANGYFFTVWQKKASGEWKFLFDVGTDTGPKQDDSAVITQQVETRRGVEITMLEAEADFIRLFKMDSARAYQLFFSETSLQAREGTGLMQTAKQEPATNRETEGQTLFSALGNGIAASGDLGYVYGTALLNGKKDAYLRIWRHEPKGWKIALQLIR